MDPIVIGKRQLQQTSVMGLTNLPEQPSSAKAIDETQTKRQMPITRDVLNPTDLKFLSTLVKNIDLINIIFLKALKGLIDRPR